MATITDTGLEILAKLAGGVDSVPAFTDVAVGEGTGAESETDTALGSEVDRETATVSYEATAKTVWFAEFEFTSSYTLREVGIFDSNGNMLMRHLWSVDRNVISGDGAEVTLKMTSGRGS